ncbi:DUF2059 domain-containing protein [Caenimonas koreensis DSM 17982]|uniref:DUF2059 domain-containing protein n=1 Tax=Caenimonas koreensis DSM 17982 TaxID=1121255 RepID=A0A844B8Z0_9BURK|nr:DUF2059 domain-containing protein [Caenimonas koreensis]MRD48069.1 DUF2059 domain-containing protein [Caenimonas koreensis DSM 17982]
MRALSAFVIGVLFWGAAVADEATRRETIAKIVEAQGLTQMFQQQLDQGKASASDIGKNIVQKMLAETGAPRGQTDPRLEQVFQRYLERCAAMFSARELVDTWSQFYGKDLTESELDQILAYYQSPVGKKDVFASQTAMTGFSKTMSAQGQERLNASISQLMTDLKTALAK